MEKDTELVKAAKKEIEKWARREGELVRHKWAVWINELHDKLEWYKRDLTQWERNAWATYYVGYDAHLFSDSKFAQPEIEYYVPDEGYYPGAYISDIPLHTEWTVIERAIIDIHTRQEKEIPGSMVREICITHIIRHQTTGNDIGYIREEYVMNGNKDVTYALYVEWAAEP